MSATDAAKLNGSTPTCQFNGIMNGSISTEDGGVLLEKSRLVDLTSPIRNNQTDTAVRCRQSREAAVVVRTTKRNPNFETYDYIR